ncbi:hypothetical protein L6164_002827 [Bauhinia variegata]|uniref:Uncharacterized protein n=2 Tax=Bauhinia variegata TaxID=167791 RepID=A0ACB9Q4V2_BAUVA|nr:hypothetical protein L6164_002807 [Bauhinia variegata]KAI4353907.1 hypothetical protein L6164_002827 [Bauhinia variegata]
MAFTKAFIILILVVLLSRETTTFQNVTAANSNSSSPNEEANALLQGKGWGRSDINISNRCIWDGIKCNEAGSITKISWEPFYSSFPGYRTYWGETYLSDINFTAFPNLVHLNLSGVELEGSIPAQIGTLKKLTLLDLSNNSLFGALPRTLANLSQLTTLDVSDNHIRGGIPAHIGTLEKLTHLHL